MPYQTFKTLAIACSWTGRRHATEFNTRRVYATI